MSSLLYRSGKRLSPSFQEFIKHHGEEPILSLTIYRCPISPLTHRVANLLLFGQWNDLKRAHRMDTIFHYFLIINDTYLLEKTAIPIIKYDISLPSGSERLPIIWDTSERPTLSAFLEKGMEKYGDEFFSYHMEVNNCATFIEKLLHANGLLSTHTEHTERVCFLRQDLTSFMNSIPILSKVLITITIHFHAILQYIYEEIYHILHEIFQRCLHMIASICYFCMFMMESLVCILYTSPTTPIQPIREIK
jgi:hypothetical protein